MPLQHIEDVRTGSLEGFGRYSIYFTYFMFGEGGFTLLVLTCLHVSCTFEVLY